MAEPTGATGVTRVSTPRGRQRRQQLLHATAELVAARGFHAVGIADIGAAAGVSGAAIYRHFKDKTEMLVALLDAVVDELLIRADDIAASGGPPDAMLDALVAHHVGFALRERALIAVYLQEQKNLPEDDRSRLRRNQRRYVLLWASVLERLRPELSSEEVRTRVQATFGLLNSVSTTADRLSGQALADLLHKMAVAAATS